MKHGIRLTPSELLDVEDITAYVRDCGPRPLSRGRNDVIEALRGKFFMIRYSLAETEHYGNNVLAAVIAERLGVPHAHPTYSTNTFNARFPRLVRTLETFERASEETRLGRLRAYIAQVNLCTPDATDADRVRLVAYAIQPFHAGNDPSYIEHRIASGEPSVLRIDGRPVFRTGLIPNLGKHALEWPSPYQDMPVRTA